MSNDIILPTRRGFLGLFGGALVATIASPAIVRASSIMPVRALPVREVFLDRALAMFPPMQNYYELDRFLLQQLTDEAGRANLRIRRPRFVSYETNVWIDPDVRRNAPHWRSGHEHRRCVAEFVV